MNKEYILSGMKSSSMFGRTSDTTELSPFRALTLASRTGAPCVRNHLHCDGEKIQRRGMRELWAETGECGYPSTSEKNEAAYENLLHGETGNVL